MESFSEANPDANQIQTILAHIQDNVGICYIFTQKKSAISRKEMADGISQLTLKIMP